MNELDVEHENVFMKYFWFQPYRGMPIYRWYKNFKVGNITSYDVFEDKFLQEWGVKDKLNVSSFGNEVPPY